MKELGQIRAEMRTDVGQVRDHNEDFVASREPVNLDDVAQHGWVYIVADGVGGADAGEVASQMATERALAHYLANADNPNWGERIQNAMQQANTDLRSFVAERGGQSRMATTMVMASIRPGIATLGNVGDSRGYHWRQGTLRQITRDQSLVAKLVEEGAITAAEAENHPRRNVILYSIGSENQPRIDIFEQDMQPGDMLLLCSDGLTRHVPDQEISTIIDEDPPDIACGKLVSLANERGGEDNISVAVIQYDLPGPAATLTMQPVTRRTAVSPASEPTQDRRALWLLTAVLALVQIILTFLVWFFLRV
jgi:serine/threonine protein phosphatase PrpC